MKCSLTLLCMWLLLLGFSTASAQVRDEKPPRPEKTERPRPDHYAPMPFPVQNLNPDPGVNNDLGVKTDGTTLGVTRFDTMAEIPTQGVVPGSKGLAESLKGNDSGMSGRAFSSMMLVSDPEAYPASTMVRLIMTFPTGYSSQCSGALIDAKHVLTAGHCVYRHVSGGWATEVEVAPAYDNGENEFFGTANRGAIISWDGWIQNQLWEHDMAVVELDRPVGALTGWLGYGYNNNNAYFTGNTFHNYSYPGESPYNGHRMYYRNGNFDTPQTLILSHNNYSWGGQSGSGAPNSDEIAYSCLSHGTTNTTGHTRINSTKFGHIEEFIDENTPSTPDLIALRTLASHDFIEAGNVLNEVSFLLHNYSSATYNGTVNINYYLSEDDYITSGDVFLGNKSITISNLTGKSSQWIWNYSLMNIPAYITAGNYYIGVHITNPDVNTLNNYSDYQDAFPIQILCSTPVAPILNYTGDVTICDNDTITLMPVNSCNHCLVYWSTGDSGPTLDVTGSGAYFAQFYKECGAVSGLSGLLVANLFPEPQIPDIQSSGPTEFCDGGFVSLQVTNVCSGCNVYWSNGQSGPSIYVFDSGYYTATVENSCGQAESSTPLEIIVNHSPAFSPEIYPSGSTILCNGGSVNLISIHTCLECEVVWSNGQTGTVITVSTSGDYTAYLVNECGESSVSNTVTITAGSPPPVLSVSATGPTQICPGQTVTLQASNVCTGCTVQWSGGQTGTSIQVNTAGTYTAHQINVCGQSQISNAIQVTVENLPAAPAITPAGTVSVCTGGSLLLSAENVCAGCTVHWSDGQTGQEIYITAPGTYTATVSNVCGQSPLSNTVQVMTAPPFVPVVQINSGCHLAASNGISFQWLLNGVEIQGANSQFYTAHVAGYYTVVVSTSAGCEGTSEPVFVNPCTTSTTNSAGKSLMQLYPNPATTFVRLEWRSEQPLTDVRLELYAPDGQAIGEIWQSTYLSGHTVTDIHLPDLPDGLYVYVIKSREQHLQGRLVVLR